MKYDVILVDCPWSMSDSLKMSNTPRGAESNYSVMTTEELCKLPINDVANQSGCVLALWVLGSMLEDGLRVMKAWGFEQKQIYVWVKTKKRDSISDLIFKQIKKSKFISSSIQVLCDNSLIPGDWLLAFGMGRLFRQTHEICLIGTNNNKIYKKLSDKSQRSVCFAENFGHSIKPDNLHESFDKMFKDGKKLEVFARRQYKDWTCIGNEVCNGEDIKDSLNRLKNA